MKRSLLGFLVVFGLALVLSLSAPPAQATIIDFGSGGAQGGILTYNSGVPSVVGVGIPLDQLIIIGAPNPAKNGTYDLSGTAPDFSGGNGSASLDFSTITHIFTITGDVSGLGVGQQALLTGTIGTWTFTPGSVGTFNVTSGTDSKSLDLLHAIGFVGNGPFFFTFSGFDIGTQLTSPSADGTITTYSSFSADIPDQSVPEPGILILLGIGLSAVGVLSRRIKL